MFLILDLSLFIYDLLKFLAYVPFLAFAVSSHSQVSMWSFLILLVFLICMYVCMYVSLLWESFKLCQSICFSHSWKRWLWTMCSNLDYSWLSPWSKIVSLNCLVLFLWSDRQSMVCNLGSENTLSLIGYDCNMLLPLPKKKKWYTLPVRVSKLGFEFGLKFLPSVSTLI